MQTDVLVVGAGPTGLRLGAELGLAGVTPVVIDALPAPSGQAKGGVVQPRTAEVFDLRGMMDELQECALPHEPVGGHFGGLPVELDCRPWNTRHPYPVPIPHERVEQLLTERLAGYDVAVCLGHELTALHPEDDGVIATVGSATPPGKSSITASAGCSSPATPPTSTHHWWSRPQPRHPGRVQPRLETRRPHPAQRPSRVTRQLSH